MHFTISIPVKPYIKRFADLNFGAPADLSGDKELHKFVLRSLKKPDTRYEYRYKEKSYTDTIEVLISEDYFYRYGWELSKTDMVTFCSLLENRAKTMMRTVVGIYKAVGLPQYIAINKFQEKFNFTEDVWSFDSIKKDFYRNAPQEKINFDSEIFVKIDRLILENLSVRGTVSHKLIKEYENDKQAV
jgi:hypothetical protein